MNRNSLPHQLDYPSSTEQLSQQFSSQKLSQFELSQKTIESDALINHPIQSIQLSEKQLAFNHKNRFHTNPDTKLLIQQEEEKKIDYQQQQQQYNHNNNNKGQQSRLKQQKNFDEELNWAHEDDCQEQILDNQVKSTKNKRLDCSKRQQQQQQSQQQPQQQQQQQNDSLNEAFYDQDQAVIMDDDDNEEVNEGEGEFQLLADAQLKQELDTEQFYEKQEKMQNQQNSQQSFLKSRFRAALKQDQLYTDQVIKQCRFNNLNNEEENDFEHLFQALNQN